MNVLGVCAHDMSAACNQPGMSKLKYQRKTCEEWVCRLHKGLFSISYNQGVSETYKHKIDFNWVGVNFLLEGFEVRMKEQSKTLLIETVGRELAREDSLHIG